VSRREENTERRERNSLNEDIEDDGSTRNTNHGQLNKWKKPPLDALEHHPRRKERQASEALKTWVKLT
jgi:hypothetical protein